MPKMRGTGLMMVWCEVPADVEEEFNQWYNTEHLQELLSVPGVLNAARYEATSSGPKHLAMYELESADVINTDAFKNRPPTPWGQKVGPRAVATTLINNVYTMIHPNRPVGRVGQLGHVAGAADRPDGRSRRERRGMEQLVLRRVRAEL